MMKGVHIRKLKPIEENDRGKVYEWCKGVDGKQVTVYLRNKSVKFGCHYHRGDDPSKNPERFFLIKGKVKLFAKNLKTGEELETTIDEGTEILIEPWIYHEMKALTNVIFIEYRKTPFKKERVDSYKLSLDNKV